MTTIRVVAHCLLDPETRLAGLSGSWMEAGRE